jgi:hypothetical protein
MHDTLAQLVNSARERQAVATAVRPDGMEFLACPLDDDVLVGVGYGNNASHWLRTRSVLRKRASNLARFGSWLPALLSDGGFKLTMRIPRGGEVTEEMLTAAEELLT